MVSLVERWALWKRMKRGSEEGESCGETESLAPTWRMPGWRRKEVLVVMLRAS